MKKNDIKIIVAVLVIAGAFYLVNQYRISKMDPNTLYAQITVDGEAYEKVPINDEKEIRIETEKGLNVIKVYDDGVEMIEADCPDHVCEKTGFISKVGRTIVCLPHNVYVEIIGDTEDEIDAISE